MFSPLSNHKRTVSLFSLHRKFYWIFDPDNEIRSTRAVLLTAFNRDLVVPKFTEGWKSLFACAAVMANVLRRILSTLLIAQNLEFK